MDKNKKKFVIIGSTLIVLATLAAVVFSTRQKTEKLLKIGVLQFVEHEALDSAYKGFVDELSENGFKDSENIKIEFKNAQGNAADCHSIANQFVSDKKDLILAIATPAALSVANATTEIPIVATAITNFETAGLVKSHQKPETNVTGVSDLAPVLKQIGLIKELLPNAKTVGILYSSGEPNSQYQANLAIEECKKLNLAAKTYTFSQSSELQSVIESSKGAIDALYAPTDNIVASNIDLVVRVAAQNKVPLITWNKETVSKGAIGTYCTDYYDIGRLTGTCAIKILKGEEKPQNIPIEYLKENKLVFNQKIADQLCIKIPDKFQEVAEFLESYSKKLVENSDSNELETSEDD